MPDPVNLNRVRKQRARAEKKARADRNAVTFGRSKAEKARDRAEAELSARRLEGQRLEKAARDGDAGGDADRDPETGSDADTPGTPGSEEP